MENNIPINEIIARAQKLGLPMRELCEAAGVSHSTWWRWQQPEANPRLRDMWRAIEAMNRVLSEREMAMLADLSDRYPDAARRQLKRKEDQDR